MVKYPATPPTLTALMIYLIADHQNNRANSWLEVQAFCKFSLRHFHSNDQSTTPCSVCVMATSWYHQCSWLPLKNKSKNCLPAKQSGFNHLGPSFSGPPWSHCCHISGKRQLNGPAHPRAHPPPLAAVPALATWGRPGSDGIHFHSHGLSCRTYG